VRGIYREIPSAGRHRGPSHQRAGASARVFRREYLEMDEWEKFKQTYLAEADQHIAAATARSAYVQADIANLERDGRDASAARDVLEALERSLELMRNYRGVVVQLLSSECDLREQPCSVPTSAAATSGDQAHSGSTD